MDSDFVLLNNDYSYVLKHPNADDTQLYYLNSLMASLALKQNKPDKAYTYLSQQFDEKRMSPSYVYMHNKRMMEYYSCVGDYKKAYGYLELVNIYDDSIRNITRINNISEIESRYSQDTIILHKDVIIANSKAELSKMTTKTAIIKIGRASCRERVLR